MFSAMVEAVVRDQRENLGRNEELLDLCFLLFSVRGVFSLLKAPCWTSVVVGGVARGTEV